MAEELSKEDLKDAEAEERNQLRCCLFKEGLCPSCKSDTVSLKSFVFPDPAAMGMPMRVAQRKCVRCGEVHQFKHPEDDKFDWFVYFKLRNPPPKKEEK